MFHVVDVSEALFIGPSINVLLDDQLAKGSRSRCIDFGALTFRLNTGVFTYSLHGHFFSSKNYLDCNLMFSYIVQDMFSKLHDICYVLTCLV